MCALHAAGHGAGGLVRPSPARDPSLRVKSGSAQDDVRSWGAGRKANIPTLSHQARHAVGLSLFRWKSVKQAALLGFAFAGADEGVRPYTNNSRNMKR